MNIKGIFDSHAHYDDEKFNDDRFELLDTLKSNGMKGIINVGCDFNSSKTAIEFSKKYKGFIFPTIGLHPQEADNLPKDYIKILSKLLDDNKNIVAVGEIGLDYHWEEPSRDLQKALFISQLELAKSYNLPVIIHSRDATEDTMNILKEYKPKGVVHCFSGSFETAKEILNLGMYIGFTGVVTFNNAKKALKALEVIPLDRVLVETDCPYMAPVPLRGQRCNSGMLEYTITKIAEIKNVSFEEIVNITAENTKNLFGV